MNKRWWNDRTKALLFRAWAAGAVCFFAAWGKQPASAVTGSDGMVHMGAAYSLDLILGLIVFLILADWIIVNPVVKMAFDLGDGPAPEGILVRAGEGLLHILRVASIVAAIVGTYYVLNTALIGMRGLARDSVPVPLEPILFGVLYGAYHVLWTAAAGRIKKLFSAQKTAPQGSPR